MLAAERMRAMGWGLCTTAILALLIVFGSRSLDHFDAALVGYTFATLFATFGITYRYAMWLQRPPTRLYWRRGWQAFLQPSALGRNLATLGRRMLLEIAANRFIFRRGRLRGAAHWLIMWGCLSAAAITFPLVFGWIHFETVPGDFAAYRTYVFGSADRRLRHRLRRGVRHFPRSRVVVAAGDRGRHAGVPAPHDRPRRPRAPAVRSRRAARCCCCSRSASPA